MPLTKEFLDCVTKADWQRESVAEHEISNLVSDREAFYLKNPSLMALMGEIEPGVDVRDLDEALEVTLRFARLLEIEQPVVIPGKTTLLDLERRVYFECHRQGVFHVNVETKELPQGVQDHDRVKPFEKVWIPMDGSGLPITAKQLKNARMRLTRWFGKRIEPSQAGPESE